MILGSEAGMAYPDNRGDDHSGGVEAGCWFLKVVMRFRITNG
jgi:hypothetical protein